MSLVDTRCYAEDNKLLREKLSFPSRAIAQCVALTSPDPSEIITKERAYRHHRPPVSEIMTPGSVFIGGQYALVAARAGRNARILRGTRERPIRFQWTHFNRGHCIRISLRYAMIYGSLHVLVAVAREKKPLSPPLPKKLRVDRACHRRNGRTGKEVIGVPCISFRPAPRELPRGC